MRMHFYSEHCRACPELIGDVVPEAVFDSDTYDSVIYEPIRHSMLKLDTDHVLEVDYLNARGASRALTVDRSKSE